jgi:hypothetical protein
MYLNYLKMMIDKKYLKLSNELNLYSNIFRTKIFLPILKLLH